MELTRHQNAEAFLKQAGAFLADREAEHNLILGLSSRLRREPLLYGEPPYLAVVEDGGEVVAVALRTPPHNLVLSEIDRPGVIDPLVGALRPMIERSSTDLPAPDPPTTPRTSPRFTSRSR